MTEVKSCPICGTTSFTPFLQCKDYTVSQETFNLVKCTQCTFVITTPRPDDEHIGRYYQSDNYISHANKATGVVDKIYLQARNYTLQWKLDLVNNYYKPFGAKTILDYGCGTGEFLKKCKDNTWNIVGVEPSDDARAKSSQTTEATIHSSIETLTQVNLNIITLWHVLEHVPNLDELLTQLRERLANNGTIFIAVPNHASADGQRYKQHWAGYDVPRHLWHFSPKTMRELLNKNGLRLDAMLPMKLDAYYISLLSEKYIHGKQSIFTMVTAALNGLRSNLKAKRSGQYSSLIYIVKK